MMQDSGEKRSRKRQREPAWVGDSQAAPLISIRKSDVPAYLQKGVFFQSFGEDDDEDETIDVPSNILKADKKIADCAEFDHLLCSLRFWGVEGLVPEAIEFGLKHENWQKLHAILLHYESFFPVLGILIEHHLHPEQSILYFAAHYGDLELLKYLYETRKNIHNKDGDAAAEEGHFECLRFLVEKGFKCYEHTLHAATLGGSKDCLLYVIAKMRWYSSSNFRIRWRSPIKDHNIDCFIYAYLNLRDNGGPVECSDECYGAAMLYKGPASIDYGMKEGMPLLPQLYTQASSSNTKLEAFKYLHTVGCPWPEGLCTALCRNYRGGFIEFLRFAHSHGCPWDPREVIETAARYGEERCFQYAHSQSCPWDERVVALAAGAHTVKCVQFAHKHGCPWDVTACVSAVKHASIANLKYLHKNGCPWDASVYLAAKRGSACEKYLLEHGCPTS